MKKYLSLLLIILVLFTMALPAMAVTKRHKEIDKDLYPGHPGIEAEWAKYPDKTPYNKGRLDKNPPAEEVVSVTAAQETKFWFIDQTLLQCKTRLQQQT